MRKIDLIIFCKLIFTYIKKTLREKIVNSEKELHATEIPHTFLSNLSLYVKYFPNLILSTTLISK